VVNSETVEATLFGVNAGGVVSGQATAVDVVVVVGVVVDVVVAALVVVGVVVDVVVVALVVVGVVVDVVVVVGGVVVDVVVVVLVVVVVVPGVVVEPWHELPGHGLGLAEAPGAMRTAVAPPKPRSVRNEKMAAILDKAAALQGRVECRSLSSAAHHPLASPNRGSRCQLSYARMPRSGVRSPSIGALDARFRALECSDEASGGEEAEQQQAQRGGKRDADSLERVIVARQVRKNRIHRRSVMSSRAWGAERGPTGAFWTFRQGEPSPAAGNGRQPTVEAV
jgi:hypothetical protein